MSQEHLGVRLILRTFAPSFKKRARFLDNYGIILIREVVARTNPPVWGYFYYNMCNEEIWKDVQGYEGIYQVSNFGRVKSLPRKMYNGHGLVELKERLLVPNTLAKGYFQVTLYKDQTRKCFQVHRLVAAAFIANPNNYPQINHLNGDKQDNRPENLEWCNNSMNQIHAWKIGLQKPHHCGGGAPKKKVGLLDNNGNVEKEFESIRAASLYMGCPTPANLSHHLHGGKVKSIYGRKFIFL